MKTIWKFPLQLTDVQHVYMPQGAEILSAAFQYHGIHLWAMVDPMAPQTPRAIRIVGTGHDIDDNPGKFIGTVLMEGGQFVWHVFDGGEQ